MRLSPHDEAGCTVLAVEGRLDTAATQQFDAWWDGWISSGGRRLVLDLGPLTYISSSGLGSFVAVAKRLSDLGGSLILARPAGLVKEVFAISKLDTVIPVVPDVPTAVSRNSG